MAEVFLSYARPDADAAGRVARELGKAGFSVWYDRELPAHKAYADVIASELESAAAVLVLWSKASAESQWVRSEANRARELNKLVQARVGNGRLPMPFDQIQCADLTKWRSGSLHAGWSQVRSSIDALVGGDHSAERVSELGTHTDASRRRLLAATGAAVIAATIGTGFWLRGDKTDHPNPEVALLLQKGIDTLQMEDVFALENPGHLRNAIALLTEATQADPRSSDAWGALALAYAALKRVSGPVARPGLDQRSRSAASRALTLDAHEPRATAALLLLSPLYGHWVATERADRQALKTTPRRVPLLSFILSEMLQSVGRCKEAAAVSNHFDRRAFIIPGADERVLLGLWSAGDLQGADEALRLAVEHWPQHSAVWRTRLAYLMYSGRPAEALDLLHNESERPPGTSPNLVDAIDATAKALAGRGSSSEAVARNLTYLKTKPEAVFSVLHACAALGNSDTIFAIAEGYYFGVGVWGRLAPLPGGQDRATDALFQPPMKSAWSDGRFAQLLQRTGLEDYWRQSGTMPDFRRR